MIDELTTAGTETQLVALIRHLDRRRVEPFLCLLRGDTPISRSLEPEGCPVLRLGVRSFRHPSTLVKALRLMSFLRKKRIDIFQVYFLESTYFALPLAWLAGVPHLVRTRNNLGYWMTPWRRRLGRLYNRVTRRTIANCEACRQSLLADEGPAPESVVVLENGVDLERFRNVPRFDPQRRPRCVGVVANLRPVKDLNVFVRAAAEVGTHHPDVSFRIGGEGPLRPDLEQLVASLGLQDRCLLPGTVPDVATFLAELDVAVLSSRSEGMSNSLLEYMAAGRPIVATDVGANGQMIEHGVHGLLVPAGAPALLAAAINRLLDDANLAQRLGDAARRRAWEQYSREAMVRRFEDFYLSLLGRET
jgi:glycosyltransferase involved in cell wall biosynthesis